MEGLPTPKATDVPATHAVKYEITGTSSNVKLDFRNEHGKSEQLPIAFTLGKAV